MFGILSLMTLIFGFKYYCIFIDECYKRTTIYFMNGRDEMVGTFEIYVNLFDNLVFVSK